MSTSDGRTTGPAPEQQQCARRVHPLNTIVGSAFLAVVGLWLAADQDVLQGREVGPAVAVVLIVLGTAGVAGTLLVGRRPRSRTGPAPSAAREDERDVVATTEADADRPDAGGADLR